MRIIQPLVGLFENLSSQVPIMASLYGRPYIEVVRRELALAEVEAGDVLLNVGCGAVPFTAMHAAALADVTVVAVDCCERAVLNASQCVKRMGLEDRIRVMHQRGEALTGLSFSSAIVALQAEPKQAIWEQLSRLAPPGTPLVFRVPRSGLSEHYDTLEIGNGQAEAVSQPMKTFDRSVMVRTGVSYGHSA